ncbi:MAG: hypothetical protein R2856_27850 [Caldilineaceae bacterium]
MRNSTIMSNTAVSHGGGIWHQNSGTMTIEGSEFGYNRGANGGAYVSNDSVQTLITDSVFSHNYAGGNGGAVWIINNDDGLTQIVNSTFTSNQADGRGGGIYNDVRSTMFVTDTIVQRNQAGTSGGGIHTDKILTLHDTQIVSNSVTIGDGGGLALGNSSAVVTQTGVITLAYNQAGNQGGGVYVGDGRLTLDGARILSNQANTGGAFYQNDFTDAITVTNSCIVFNSDTAVFYENGGPAMTVTGNWWGAKDGPSGAASGHGDSVNTLSSIDVSGFLTTAPVGCPTYTPVLTLGGGDNQITQVDQAFTSPLSITLSTVEQPRPIIGAVITFTGPSSGAGITPAIVTATTDVDGIAEVTPTANGDWGDYEVTAVAEYPTGPITFALQNYTFYALTTATGGVGSGTVTAGAVYTSSTVVTITCDCEYRFELRRLEWGMRPAPPIH